jgi:hypothetical protein
LRESTGDNLFLHMFVNTFFKEKLLMEFEATSARQLCIELSIFDTICELNMNLTQNLRVIVGESDSFN